MLRVTARQVSNPVAVFVLMEAGNNRLFCHGCRLVTPHA
jgi:hypothetical protein